MVYKNQAGQKVAVFAVDSTGAPKTGDAANITARVSKDGGAVAQSNDVNPTELDATYAKGIYLFDATQAETNADLLVLTAASSTSGVTIRPVVVYTEPALRTANVTQVAGTGQTARDLGAALVGTLATGTHNPQGGDAYARLGAPAGASTAADIAAIAAKTTNLPASPAAVGSNMGTVSSVTAGVTVTTNNDKTGYALSAAGVQAVWDALTSALTTAGSIGKRLVDYLTGDIFARLGAPAGASMSADVAAVKALLPTALVGGKIDAHVNDIAANAITASALATDAVSEIADGVWDEATSGHQAAGTAGLALTSATAPSAASVADAVWDEALSGHTTSGTAGSALSTASSGGVDPAVLADAICDEALSGHSTAGTVGKALSDAATQTTASAIRTDVGLATANLDTQLGAIAGYIDTEVSAIKSKTDNLPASPAAAGDCLTAAGVRSAVGLASANLDTQLSAANNGTAPSAATVASQVRTELTTELGRIDATVGSRLASSGYTAPPSAASVADAVLDEALSGHATAGTAGKALTDAAAGGVGAGAVADAVLNAAVADHQVAGSVGKAIGTAGSGGVDPSLVADAVLGAAIDDLTDGSTIGGLMAAKLPMLGSGQIVTTYPLSASGASLTIKIGDSYLVAEGRSVSWSADSWVSDLKASPTPSAIRLVAKYGYDVWTSTLSATAARTVQLELTAAQTATLKAGRWRYDIEARWADGRVETLVTGGELIALEDIATAPVI